MVSVVRNKKKLTKRKIAKSKISYSLPKKKSTPLEDLGGYSILIFGRKKIGKTTLCNQFPDTLFLFFEPGGKALTAYQETMETWKKFQRFVDLVVKDKTFKTIVIDTADFAYEECSNMICFNLDIADPAELGWGEGWRKVKKEFSNQIKRLLLSGKGVIFISHQRELEIEDRMGKVHSMKTNTLSKQAKETIEGLVDIWANYDYIGEDRYLTVIGSEEEDCGHRLKHKFRYSDGTRIRRIPMGNSEEQSYENFLKAFNNTLERPKGGVNTKRAAKKKTSNLRKRKTKRRK